MRLINANDLKKKAYAFPCATGVEYAVPLRAINESPTIDAEPVRHGRWVEGIACSECRQVDLSKPNYCPNCGAKMNMYGDEASEG